MNKKKSNKQKSAEAKTNVNDKAFGYWVICVQSYEYDGIEIPKRRMSYHQSTRPIISNKWRRATQEEIDTRQYHKGNAFNLINI